jgi:protein-disulfide isomerase
MNKGAMILGGLVLALVGAGGVLLATGADTPVDTSDKAAVERIVRDYILEHPEVVTQALDNLQTREIKKVVEANRVQLETPFGSAWDGAADANVTLVQFFDYNCGYCRASLPDIDRLLAEDKKLKVVYRELPILGQSSLDAAKVSLAVAQQKGNYGAFHRAVYAGGRITSATLGGARKIARVDEGAAKAAESSAAVNDEIAANLGLQEALKISGTPSWVVGDQILNGAVGYEALKAAVAKARADGVN